MMKTDQTLSGPEPIATRSALAEQTGHWVTGTILDTLSTGILILDENGRALGANPAWRAFAAECSDAAAALAAIPETPVLHADSQNQPQDQSELAAGIREILRGGSAEFAQEYLCAWPDGPRSFLGRARRLAGAGTTRVLVTCEEITELKRLQNALEESEARLRSIASASMDGLFQLDQFGSLVTFNPAAERMFGYTAGEILGKDLGLLFPTFDRLQCTRESQASPSQAGSGDTSTYRGVLARRGDGSTFTVDLALGQTSWTEPHWTTGVCRDATERHYYEAAIAEARHAAQLAHRGTTEYLGALSHEFRNGLGGVLGMIDLALESDLTAVQRDCLETAVQSAGALVRLLSSIVDFSRLEAGSLVLEQVDFDLHDVLTSSIEPLTYRARDKHLELGVRVDPATPTRLRGDANRLRLVLTNLVENAIKFTSRGRVDLHVTPDESENHDRPPLIRFTVADTGIGIPSDDHERIFHLFESNPSARRYHGLGLGLTLAGRLVTLMGGAIELQSEPGRGSTFTFAAELAHNHSRGE